MSLEVTLLTLYLLLLHWVADFLFQTKWMGTSKSHSNKALLAHTIIYTAIMMAGLLPMLNLGQNFILTFGIITFVVHTVQDYITSRLNAHLWKKQSYSFFMSVGFDQWLHFVQIFLTYHFIKH